MRTEQGSCKDIYLAFPVLSDIKVTNEIAWKRILTASHPHVWDVPNLLFQGSYHLVNSKRFRCAWRSLDQEMEAKPESYCFCEEAEVPLHLLLPEYYEFDHVWQYGMWHQKDLHIRSDA